MATDFQKILTELNELGLSDSDIAEKVKLDRSMISRLRNGKRDQPKYDHGVAIMKVYNESKKSGRAKK